MPRRSKALGLKNVSGTSSTPRRRNNIPAARAARSMRAVACSWTWSAEHPQIESWAELRISCRQM